MRVLTDAWLDFDEIVCHAAGPTLVPLVEQECALSAFTRVES